jgi:hypothetical protein
MIHRFPNRTETAGTTRTGIKIGIIERLAEGALVLGPVRDHDELANELHQQLHRQLSAESGVYDASEILRRYIGAGVAERETEPELVFPAVVYFSTDATTEPAADVVDQAVTMVAELASFPHSGAPSGMYSHVAAIPHDIILSRECGALSAFIITSMAPEQRWLCSIVSRILSGSSDLPPYAHELAQIG